VEQEVMTRIVFICLLLVVVLALPAGAQARTPAGFVGMTSEELGGIFTTDAYMAETLAAQRRAGVNLLRQTFNWGNIESRPGGEGSPSQFDWSLQDRLVLAAARNGISVLPLLFDAPPFYSSRPAVGAARATYPPRDPSTMASFATEAVKRFGPGGALWRENPGAPARPIRAWQVWNEPSLKAYWGGRPNAGAYVKLLKAVNDAIKRVDAGAEVVTAGMPPSVLPGSVPIGKYIDQMYKAGGKRAFDTLAVNTYARSDAELRRLLNSVRKIMNRRGDRSAKIWITELGWCDSGPKSRFCVGSRKQASLITSSLRTIRSERKRLRLRGFVYFSWRDGRPYAPDFRDQWGLHTGLLKVGGKPKPSLRAFTRGVRPFR